MPVVGSADDHGVDVRARQHFAIIARREYLVSPAFFGSRQPALINVRGGYDLDAMLSKRGDCVFRSHSARADQRNLYAVVGRLGLGSAPRVGSRHAGAPVFNHENYVWLGTYGSYS